MNQWYAKKEFWLGFIRMFARSHYIAAILAVAVFASVFWTYYAITNSDNVFGPSPEQVIGLIILDLILILALVAVIIRRLVMLFIQRRQGVTGSRLQSRIIIMFSLVAIIPAVVMAIFSAIFFNLGIQVWFDKQIDSAIGGAVNVAQSYLEDHKKIIKADIQGLGVRLSQSAHFLRDNPKVFNQVISALTQGSLSEVVVLSRDKVIAKSNLSFFMSIDGPTEEDFNLADLGNVVILSSDDERHRVRALMRLDNFLDAYLLVGRLVDEKIVHYMELSEEASSQYSSLKDNIAQVEIKYFMVFVIVSLLILLIVVWIGFVFAVNLVKPISVLLEATEKVKEGNLAVRVPEGHDNDEISVLSRAFNRMTKQLRQQRIDLVSAQRWAAWSDVARRIAHEIKNPLTPIQLASQRLEKKFKNQVQDIDLFEKYLSTISNNVSSIGKMVEEFANFARLPAPDFEDVEVCQLIKEIAFSREAVAKGVEVKVDIPNVPVYLYADKGQLSRVLTNLIKNAEESIVEKHKGNSETDNSFICVKLVMNTSTCSIVVTDDGMGFDALLLGRITEPYVTTKSKGTGLGLSIVKKIVEDHHGTINFSNHDNGACVTMEFPVTTKQE